MTAQSSQLAPTHNRVNTSARSIVQSYTGLQWTLFHGLRYVIITGGSRGVVNDDDCGNDGVDGDGSSAILMMRFGVDLVECRNIINGE